MLFVNTINYIGMIPVLAEAIKEQQSQIERLQQTVSDQIYEIAFLRETMDKNTHQENNPLKSTSVDENNSQTIATAKLFQNISNPFSMNTEIRFEIPESSNTAKLLIHDMQGAEIKSYTITTKGVGNITIQGHELPAGMYMYTLLVNNTIRTLTNHNIIDPIRIILSNGIDSLHLPPTSPSFTEYMYVDYIKVHQLKCDKYTVVNEISNFNTYNYAVKKSITLSGATTIPAGSNISLRATNFIELKNGFEVPLGAELYLDINPCDNTSIGTPGGMYD